MVTGSGRQPGQMAFDRKSVAVVVQMSVSSPEVQGLRSSLGCDAEVERALRTE